MIVIYKFITQTKEGYITVLKFMIMISFSNCYMITLFNNYHS